MSRQVPSLQTRSQQFKPVRNEIKYEGKRVVDHGSKIQSISHLMNLEI